MQNSFKGLQRYTILFNPTNNLNLTFTVLQLIWVSTSQSYKCMDVANDLALNFTILHHLDPTFTRPCSQQIYKIWESKQHMNLNVHKPTLLNFFLN